jgi:hypothetical protein
VQARALRTLQVIELFPEISEDKVDHSDLLVSTRREQKDPSTQHKQALGTSENHCCQRRDHLLSHRTRGAVWRSELILEDIDDGVPERMLKEFIDVDLLEGGVRASGGVTRRLGT